MKMTVLIHNKAKLTLIFFFFVFIWNTSAQTIKTVGSATSGADYTTLKEAFDAINAGTITGDIELQIITNTTETASAMLNASGTGGANYTSILIYPKYSNLSITGNLFNAPIIDLNGADNITIDGRVNSTGTVKDLTIANSNTSGLSAIRFINDATNNVVKYCKLKGDFDNHFFGVIHFSTTNQSTGNDNNIIEYNDITSIDNTHRCTNGIASDGTFGKENSNNIIRYNNIYNYFNVQQSSFGIILFQNNDAWTITGNSFYEETNYESFQNTKDYGAIKINDGTNYDISGNYIGGKAPICGGGAMTKTSTKNNPFFGISLNVGTAVASRVNNNTIQNINWSNAGDATWKAISIEGGNVDIGTLQGNVIGSGTGNGSITVIGGSTMTLYGIDITGSGTVNCQNNIIGSITAANLRTDSASNVIAIHKSPVGGYVNISSNIIGSNTTLNSIQATGASTIASQSVKAISCESQGTNIVSGNTIANLTNFSTNTATSNRAYVRGIVAIKGTNTITNNTINNLTANNLDFASVIGVIVFESTVSNTISGNTISNLANMNAAYAGYIAGIYDGHLSSSATSNIFNNYIHSFSVNTSTTSAIFYGIFHQRNISTYYNNVINLGGNTKTTIYGIYDAGNTSETCKVYFNTIYISGSLASGSTNKSYCLLSAAANNTRDFRNNILYNARSTTSGTNLHYAISLTANTTLICNYNNYYVTGTGGVLGFLNIDRTTLTDWQSATGQDGNSKNVNPNFSGTGIYVHDFVPTNTTLTAHSSTGITFDYDNKARTLMPIMGAFELTLPIEVWIGGVLQIRYQTLKATFDAVNNGTHTGDLEIRVTDSTDETASAVLNASGTGSANYSSVVIFPTLSGLSITGTLTTPLIDFNGADNVTIDGRVNRTGVNKDLTIANLQAFSTVATIRFYNDASNNTIKYCTVQGTSISSGTQGIITFAGGSVTGNINNIISNNNITGISDSKRHILGIYSVGSSTTVSNRNLIISNNNFYNLFHRGGDSWNIYFGAYTTDCAITNNSFYETATFSPTADVKYTTVYISNTSGVNFTVTDNFIGGNAPQCSGVMNVNSTYGNPFYGIYLNVGTAQASNIHGNTITNLTWRTTGATTSYWVGIMLERGNANVGTTTGNIIGSDTGTGAINIQFGGNNSEVYAYSLLPWGTGSLNCQNNKVGGLTIENTNSAYATNFYGIVSSYGNVSISNNLIGSPTATSSIHIASQSTSNAQKMYGILMNSNVQNAQITNNTIANLTNSTDNPTTSTAGFIHGIASSAEVSQISNNTIRNLSVASANTTFGSTASAIGIALTSTSSNNTVSANTIYNLTNTFSGFQGLIYGILFNGNLSSNTVNGNFIHSLTTKNSNGANIIGIYAQTGNTTYANNIITIGDGSLARFLGLYDVGAASQTCKVYHNSLYIGGISSLEAGNSYAFYSNASNNARDYRNNIFYNARYNNSGVSGKHYAAYFDYASPGSLTLDNNNYYVSGGSGSVLGYYDSSDKTTTPLISGYDTYSQTTNPGFISPGGVTATDYQLNGVKPLAATGTGITVDYSNTARPTNPTSGAWEYDVPNLWKGNISADWGDRYNWTNGTVPASGADVTFDPVPQNHAVLDINRVIGSLNNAQFTYRVVTNGKKLTINGALNLTNGAQIDASAINSTLEFAGTSATQYLPASALFENKVFNLNVKNPQNVVLSGTVRLLNALTAETGVLDASTNQPTLILGGSVLQNISGTMLLLGKVYNLTIDNSAGAVLTGNMFVENDLTLQQGDISTGTYTLFLQGSTVGLGGYIKTNVSSGRIAYTGSSAQTIRRIKDNTANALLITNTSSEGATIIGTDNSFGDLNAFNSISIASGSTLNVEAGDKLTVNNSLTNEGTFRLLSNSDGTATLLTNGSVTTNQGTYKVQQYLTGSNNGTAPDGRFWYVSSPLTGAVSGTFNLVPGFNDLWRWNEPTHSYIKIIDNISNLEVGKGYVVRLASTETVEFNSKIINNGEIRLQGLSWTGDTHINRGYNLIGNPYPSFLNWKDVWVDPNTNELRENGLPNRMRATIWVRSANSTLYTYNPVSGTYATTNPQTGEMNEPNIQYIAPMQAFWVETFDPEMSEGSITFNNSMRSHQISSDHRLRAKAAPNTEKQELRLSITDGTNTDQTVVQFNPKASDTYDLYDSHKMSFSGIPQVYTKVGKEVLSINGMGSFTNERIVPLGYSVPQAGTYTLKASEIINFGSGTQVLLVDNATASVTDLTVEDTYEFTSDKVDNYNRFTIIFRTPGTVTEIPQHEQGSIVVFRNGDNKITVICNEELQFNASVTIYNAAGQAMYNKALSGTATVVDKEFTPGVYIARVYNGEKIVSAKVIVE